MVLQNREIAMKLNILFIISLSFLISACVTTATPMGKDPSALQKAVQSFTQDQAQFIHAQVDLNHDGIQDAVVLLKGTDWCGSGGCTMLVFQGLNNKNFQLLSRSTVTNTPIYLLKSSHQGWRDLSVYSRGIGQVTLQFNGKNYPANPSLLTETKIDPTEAQLLLEH